MKKFAFTLVILGVVALALIFPEMFRSVGDFQLKKLIIPLLQIIMLGMGTTMGPSDFVQVIKTPKAVIVGLVCQFTIMPFLGFGLAHLFEFPPQIAAGIILVGCSPSGLASNVMAYIAKANVALSISITSIATLLAPLLTPFLMGQLGGEFIDVDEGKMLLDILYMVILPICIGLALNHWLPGFVKQISKLLPLISMAGIALIVAIITASGRDFLLQSGALLALAVLLHNLGGFLLGYWGARISGLPEADRRTVAIEVGLQNAGLASGLALQMGKEATVGLAAGLFGPVMNTTGSILATFWSRKPTPKEFEDLKI